MKKPLQEINKRAKSYGMTQDEYLNYLLGVEDDAITHFCECYNTKHCLQRYMEMLTKEQAIKMGWDEDDVNYVYAHPEEYYC